MTYHGSGGAGYVLPGAQVYNAVVAAAGGGSFAPTDISGCVLWLDASDVLTLYQDSAGSTPVTADGQTIGRWSDKSGNSNHATQATSSARPTHKTGIQNGLSIARLDGGDYLDAPDLQYANITVFAAASHSGAGGSYQFIVGYLHASTHTSPYFRWCINKAVTLVAHRWNGSNTVFASLPAGMAYYTLIDNDLFIDGNLESNGVDADLVYPNNVNVRVGANASGGEGWNGDIAEIIIYNSALGTTDRESVESYLATKWGL